jgi:hypothetical protein
MPRKNLVGNHKSCMTSIQTVAKKWFRYTAVLQCPHQGPYPYGHRWKHWRGSTSACWLNSRNVSRRQKPPRNRSWMRPSGWPIPQWTSWTRKMRVYKVIKVVCVSLQTSLEAKVKRLTSHLSFVQCCSNVYPKYIALFIKIFLLIA